MTLDLTNVGITQLPLWNEKQAEMMVLSLMSI